MSILTITSDIKFQRSQTVLASAVGAEMVMMDIDVGKYYGFNDVGTRIWDLLETSCSIQFICEQLLQEFDVEPETCEQEVISFIENLLEFKIVQQVEDNA